MSVTKTAGGIGYGNPWIGGVNHPAQIKVDVSGLTTDEVRVKTYLIDNPMSFERRDWRWQTKRRAISVRAKPAAAPRRTIVSIAAKSVRMPQRYI